MALGAVYGKYCAESSVSSRLTVDVELGDKGVDMRETFFGAEMFEES